MQCRSYIGNSWKSHLVHLKIKPKYSIKQNPLRKNKTRKKTTNERTNERKKNNRTFKIFEEQWKKVKYWVLSVVGVRVTVHKRHNWRDMTSPNNACVKEKHPARIAHCFVSTLICCCVLWTTFHSFISTT